MIEFYLGEHAILNNVQTYMLRDPKQCKYVLANLKDLVVKEVQGSGGYGMLIGPASTKEEREAYKARVLQNPDNFIAQPTLSLSTAPTLRGGKIVPRHVDLRPFVLSGKESSVDCVTLSSPIILKSQLREPGGRGPWRSKRTSSMDSVRLTSNKSSRTASSATTNKASCC